MSDKSRAERAEELLSACFEARDVAAAVEATAAAHPELAATLRSVFARMKDFGLMAPPVAGIAVPNIDGFTILERLGQGGMGVVYHAWQSNPGRDVAIKVVRPELVDFDGRRERFAREIEAIARLAHPGIIPVLQVGDASGTPWFSMEYVHGASLDRVLEQVEAMASEGQPARRRASELADALMACLDKSAQSADTSTHEGSVARAALFRGTWVDAAIAITAQVAAALDHAHQRGVLHRDVKASNIMLTPDGRALLFDFGLAHLDDERGLTRSSSELGSLPYLPPEVLVGNAVPHRGLDVYGLGVTFYELLCGQHPFLCKSSERTRQLILEGNAKRPRRIDKSLAWDVETVCMTAMAPEAEHRYPSCAELLIDLDRLRERKPITARTPSFLLRVRRWQQRNPRFSVAAATALVLLSLSAFVLFLHEQNARKESDRFLATSERLRANAERASYNSQIALAHASLIAGNDKVARRVLDRCEPKLRNWVWQYHDLMVDAFTSKWKVHGGKSNVIASPDRRTIASLGVDGKLVLFDATTRELRSETALRATDADGPAFSRDGRLIAVTEEGSLTLIEARTGSIVKRLPLAVRHHAPAFVDADAVLASDAKASIDRIDLGSGSVTKILDPRRNERERIDKFFFDPYGRDIGVVAVGAAHLRLFRADGTLLREVDAERRDIVHVVFAATRPELYVASSDFQLRGQVVEAFHLESGERIATIPLTTFPNCLALSPDESAIAVACSTLRTFELPYEGRGQRLHGHRHAVDGCAFDAAGRLWSSDIGGEICLFEPDDSPSMSTISGHRSSIVCLRVDPTSQHVVSGDRNGNLQVALAADRSLLAQRKLHEGRVLGIDFLAAGASARVVSLGQDRVLLSSTMPNLEATVVKTFDAKPIAMTVLQAEAEPLIAVLFDDHIVRSSATGEIRDRLTVPKGATCFAAQASTTVVGTKNGTLHVRVLSATREVALGSPILALDLNAELTQVVVATDDDLLRLVDLTSMTALRTWDEHVTQPSAVSFAPGSALIYSGAWGSSVRFWDPASEQGLGYTTIPGMVLCLDPSPDGRFVAVAGIQGKVELLWGTRKR